MTDEVLVARQTALEMAVTLLKDRQFHDAHSPSGQALAAAERFFNFLYQPAPVKHLRLVPGTISRQDGSPSESPVSGRNDSMQLHDDEQVTYTVEATDAKGQSVSGEQINYSVDNADVLSLTVSADGASATIAAGTTGSGVLTATVGSLSVTEAIDVIAGDATAITLVPGDVSKQTPSA